MRTGSCSRITAGVSSIGDLGVELLPLSRLSCATASRCSSTAGSGAARRPQGHRTRCACGDDRSRDALRARGGGEAGVAHALSAASRRDRRADDAARCRTMAEVGRTSSARERDVADQAEDISMITAREAWQAGLFGGPLALDRLRRARRRGRLAAGHGLSRSPRRATRTGIYTAIIAGLVVSVAAAVASGSPGPTGAFVAILAGSRRSTASTACRSRP